MKRILILCMGLLAFATTFAQSPQGINYQAVVRNSDGEIVPNQSVGIRISILTSLPSTVYAETHNVVTNEFGLVTLVVGNGNVTQGSFSTIDWANGPYYLQLEIDVNGGTNYLMLGSQQLMSVPYALYAESSGQAGSTGPTGPAGSDGANGTDGAAGPTGTAGSNGTNGATGPTGSNATIYAGNGITISNDSIISHVKTHTATISTTNDWTNQTTCVYFDLPSAKILGVYIQEPQGVIVKYDMGSTNWGTNSSIWNDLTAFASINEYVKEIGVPSSTNGSRWPWAIIKAERTGGSASTTIQVQVLYMD